MPQYRPEFTPGPWRVQENYNGRLNIVSDNGSVLGGPFVAQATVASNPSESDDSYSDVANAYLLAAAPAMLEHLLIQYDLAEHINLAVGAEDSGELRELTNEMRERMRSIGYLLDWTLATSHPYRQRGYIYVGNEMRTRMPPGATVASNPSGDSAQATFARLGMTDGWASGGAPYPAQIESAPPVAIAPTGADDTFEPLPMRAEDGFTVGSILIYRGSGREGRVRLISQINRDSYEVEATEHVRDLFNEGNRFHASRRHLTPVPLDPRPAVARDAGEALRETEDLLGALAEAMSKDSKTLPLAASIQPVLRKVKDVRAAAALAEVSGANPI